MGEMMHGLRWMLLIVCLLVFGLVFALMFFSAWKHHRSGMGTHTNFHGSAVVEMSWTLVPFFMVVLLVWPTARIFWNSP